MTATKMEIVDAEAFQNRLKELVDQDEELKLLIGESGMSPEEWKTRLALAAKTAVDTHNVDLTGNSAEALRALNTALALEKIAIFIKEKFMLGAEDKSADFIKSCDKLGTFLINFAKAIKGNHKLAIATANLGEAQKEEAKNNGNPNIRSSIHNAREKLILEIKESINEDSLEVDERIVSFIANCLESAADMMAQIDPTHSVWKMEGKRPDFNLVIQQAEEVRAKGIPEDTEDLI